MTILSIIELALAAASSVLTALKKTGAPTEIISEIESAVTGLSNAQNSAATLTELESLRTKPLW